MMETDQCRQNLASMRGRPSNSKVRLARMRIRRVSLFILTVIVFPLSAFADGACKTDPGVVGDCFKIRGRASLWSGNPTLRIWRIGTNRILGAREGSPIPQELKDGFDSIWNEVYGDFMVCPFTQSKPGRMQIVCVESAEILFVKRRSESK